MIEARVEQRLHVLGSACHLLIGKGATAGAEQLELAQAELVRLESQFSSTYQESVISRINQAAGSSTYVPLDSESRSLFSYVNALWTQSNHLFDPTIGVLSECYSPQGKLLAGAGQIHAALNLVGWAHLELCTEGARLPVAGMRINLDSCIRSYAVDSVRKMLIKNGVTSALIEMDRDAASIGRQPDGANWLVGLRHPKGARSAIARLKLNDRGFSLRGNFENRVTMGGENFGRALSPVDAQPIPGLLGVAVIAENCLTAGSAASIARLKTEQAGLRWLEKLGLPWIAIDRELNCHGI